jgi:hypothetical protein
MTNAPKFTKAELDAQYAEEQARAARNRDGHFERTKQRIDAYPTYAEKWQRWFTELMNGQLR